MEKFLHRSIKINWGIRKNVDYKISLIEIFFNEKIMNLLTT